MLWKDLPLILSRGRALGVLVMAPVLLLSTTLTAVPVQAAPSQLQTDADAIHNIGAVSAVAGVLDHGTTTTAVSGEFVKGGVLPPQPDARFRAGSLTKTYVATVIMQLVGEGKLSLNDPVSKFLPGVITGNGNDGAKITVGELLYNTSGLFDYTQDNSFVQQLIDPKAFYANRFHHYTQRDLINMAIAHAPNFAPGTAYAYSNTDYIVAGEIIKAVTGNTWDTEIKNRIVTPLGLTATRYPGDDPSLPWPFVFGYNIYTSDPANRQYTDTTIDNMTWAGSAGGLITTTSDQNKFMSALLSGKLLKPAQLAQMKTDTPLQPGAAIGMGHQTLSCGVEIWGHTGKVIGYSTYSLTTDDGSKSIALDVNTSTYTEVQYYLDELNNSANLIINQFCPPAATVAPQSAATVQQELTIPGENTGMNSVK